MKVLISGGSGFIGKKLTEKLQASGHEVAWLSRSDKNKIKSFVWDIKSKTIDPNAMEWADAVVHLAGASVAGKRWTADYKNQIYTSRINSSQLIIEAIKKADTPPSALVSASAVGYYGGFKQHEGFFVETDPPANDFLATLTKDWEKEIFVIENQIRTVALRIGIVLSTDGGALEQMMTPINYGVGAALASGKQVLSWIHIDDLVDLFKFSLENPIAGKFNAVAPNPVTNLEITKAIAKQLKKPLLLPAVPGFLLKVILGEFASFVIKGARVSSKKIESVGFKFTFPLLSEALRNLI